MTHDRIEREVFYRDLAKLLRRHGDRISAHEMLAIASDMLGKLIAVNGECPPDYNSELARKYAEMAGEAKTTSMRTEWGVIAVALRSNVRGHICENCGCDTQGEMAFMEDIREQWCHPCADNVETCPKCSLKADSMLHRFCTHQECPVRKQAA